MPQIQTVRQTRFDRKMKLWIVSVLILLIIQECRTDPYQCSSPPELDNGEVSCPSGTKHFDMCIIQCKTGFEMSGPSRVMCWCRNQDDCSWKGGVTTCKADQCSSPSFDNGRMAVVDKWPGGFAGIITFNSVKKKSKFRNGWSVVLVFDRQLGQDSSITSWTMNISASSFYGQTYTFSNVEHNKDLVSDLKKDPNLTFLFVAENVIGSTPEAAYAGLYNYRVQDASCVTAPQMHPVESYVASVKRMVKPQIKPTSRSTKKPKVKPKKQPTKAKAKTNTKMKNETKVNRPLPPMTMTTGISLKRHSATQTPATTATVEATTKTLQFTQPNAVSLTKTTKSLSDHGRYCKIQRQKDSYVSEKGWIDRGVQSFNANAKLSTNNFVKEWFMVIVFDIPIEKIEIWSANVLESSSDGLIWNFGPSPWNHGLPAGDVTINFVATTRKITLSKVSGQVFLCSDSFESGDALMTRPQGKTTEIAISDTSSRQRRSIKDNVLAKRVARSVGNSLPVTRCVRGYRRGNPVRNAKQTTIKFAANSDGTKYNYNELLHKSILFFEAQRSGRLPPEQRVLWRGNSNLKDGCYLKVDATGGWYDAGNFVKYNFPMAFSLTTLAWGAIAFEDAYQAAGEMSNMINLIKCPTEYLIKCHISKYEFIAQVGNPKSEDAYWGRPEQMTNGRPTYKITADKPGSELAAEAAAALAASAIVLRKSDPELSERALKHAKELYEFADKYRGKYHVAVPAAAPQYQSYSGFEDELIWAAAWLHKATNEMKFLKAATTLYAKIGGMWSVEDRYVWDRKLVGAQVLLSEITGNDIYRNPLSQYLNNLDTANTNSKGMYYLDEWAPNRYTSGSAFIALVASTLNPHLSRESSYLRWAEKQMGMILGDTGRSYVVGFGKAYPKKIRHSSSSCPPYPKICNWSTFSSLKPNHYILYGAMVGGPDKKGIFNDDRSNIKGNHVACDYNAVFQSAVAGLKHFSMKNKENKGIGSTASTSPGTYFVTSNSPKRFGTTAKPTPASTMKPYRQRPKISEKVRCARRSSVGVPVRNAKQIVPKFKANNDNTKHNYNEALHLSLLFFEAQRAGRLPVSNRVPWRGDSALKDGCDVGADVSGGWFDAGDHVKFGFPMAFSLTTLAWGGIEFRDAYVDSGEINNMIETVKWGAQFFMNAHTAKYELIGQVGNGKADHDSWGRPETMSMRRPAYKITARKPGSELAAEAAAALAASSIFLKGSDSVFATEALKHAEELYDFADKYRGLYHESIRDAKKFYKSVSGYDDELIWGAAWLYKATKKRMYLNKATRHYRRIKGKYVVETRYSWDRKLCGAQAILGTLTGHADYKQPFFKMINGLMRARTTPQGMHFLDKWGSNRYAAGAAFMAAVAAKMNPRRTAYKRWSRKQIDLILGDSGRSYVVGYGKNYPKRPHHRASSCPPYPRRCDWSTFSSNAPNYYILYGALVGGPNARGRYFDRRNLYKQTEVTTDYNACFQSAVAGVKHTVMKSRPPPKTTAKAPSTKRKRPNVTPGKTSTTKNPPTTTTTSISQVKITQGAILPSTNHTQQTTQTSSNQKGDSTTVVSTELERVLKENESAPNASVSTLTMLKSPSTDSSSTTMLMATTQMESSENTSETRITSEQKEYTEQTKLQVKT